MKGIYTIYCNDGEVFIYVILKESNSNTFRDLISQIKESRGIINIDIEPFFEVIE